MRGYWRVKKPNAVSVRASIIENQSENDGGNGSSYYPDLIVLDRTPFDQLCSRMTELILQNAFSKTPSLRRNSELARQALENYTRRFLPIVAL